ncbi:L-rhamnose catabolism isomerase [Gangjinia marincola]|uniref:L-rhamnose catabolism isomerase n=1 Tax=Gangjinia marincola TaxID=578463 RepID=A0ABN1MJG2_9FLAO
MKIEQDQISTINKTSWQQHNEAFDHLASTIKHIDVEDIISTLAEFQIAIPSWALGAGGTRFGRFRFGGEPATLAQKLNDIGVLHSLTGSAGAVSLHIPWDIPEDYKAIKEIASSHNIEFDAVNSNTFQDQPDAQHSYKFGSLSHIHRDIRNQAIAHNKEVIDIGTKLGSKSLTIWLADGSSFPGQHNFQKAFSHTRESIVDIYNYMPEDWKLFIEYKPYEPNFYSTVIQDWGTSLLLANACGERAFTLVDLGHHLPNTNIEQIVATLMLHGKLGGFHFNDSKYGDDDLTVGAIKPYALFLIFNELVYGMKHNTNNPTPSWMIDASHNIKDPLEDLLQSLDAAMIAYAKAMLIDQKKLSEAQQSNDVSRCQEILKDAYLTDVRPIVQQARLNVSAALHPLEAYRSLNVRKQLIKERGLKTAATGL